MVTSVGRHKVIQKDAQEKNIGVDYKCATSEGNCRNKEGVSPVSAAWSGCVCTQQIKNNTFISLQL